VSHEPSPTAPRRTSALSTLDKRVLLGLLVLAGGSFVAMWAASRGFMPGARLFPYFVSAAGVAMALIAIFRVWAGHEPAAAPGQVLPGADDVPSEMYLKVFRLILGIAAYFVAVMLVGFILATGVFLFVFSRRYGQSLIYCAVLTATCLAGALAISHFLDLYIPMGWLLEAF
jgi:hypothetical protein